MVISILMYCSTSRTNTVAVFGSGILRKRGVSWHLRMDVGVKCGGIDRDLSGLGLVKVRCIADT